MSTLHPPYGPGLRGQRAMQVDTFRQDIQDAVNAAFNPHPTKYEKVIVQFFRFVNDDIVGGATLERELGDYFQKYSFQVRYKIIGCDPSGISPSLEVSQILGALGSECTNKGSLVIIVFSGHGRLHPGSRSTLEVAGNARFAGPNFNWTKAVSLLSGFACDVVQILDCCAAIEAVSDLDCEVLAAASGTASANVNYSFTKAFLSALQSFNGVPTSLSMVYGHIMRNKKKFNLQYHPIYVPRTRKTSCVIQPLGNSAVPSTVSYANRSNPPKMTLSVHLDRTMTSNNVDEIKNWLTTNVPSNAKGITVDFEGLFDTDSSILIFTVDIEIWAVMRQDIAYQFMGMTTSRNKLSLGQGLPLQPLGIKGSENKKPGSPSK